MAPKRPCECKKKKAYYKRDISNTLQTFDRIEWLKKRIIPKRLIDRTVKLKYLIHPAEMNEHTSIKKVFDRFDEDGNKLLEAVEVKKNFDDHHLKVDVRSITNLFKSAAVNRKRHDPCDALSLYEFCIFSKKASNDFQKLMNNIKGDMLHTLVQRHTSTVDLGNQKTETEQILPQRKSTYIKYLPSSFNPLMNHFKDEEKRSDLRESLVSTLKEITRAGRSKKRLDVILANNAENMKGLLQSHFPEEEVDEEARRLFTQTKKESEGFEKLKEKVRNIYALQRKPSFDPANETMSKEEKVLGRVRAKTQRETREIIRNAKQRGKIEAQTLLKKSGNTVDSRTFTALDAENTARSHLITNGKSLIRSASTMKPQPSLTDRRGRPGTYVKKLLGENLVLRTTRTMTGECFTTTETLAGQKENPFLEGSMSKTVSVPEGLPKNFRLKEIPRVKSRMVKIKRAAQPRTVSLIGTYDCL